MGSGVSIEMKRELTLTSATLTSDVTPSATTSSNLLLENAKEEISRLRRKLHDQTEIFGPVTASTPFNDTNAIQERTTQQWATCHAITFSQWEFQRHHQ